jgi:hypothetical protein
MNQPNLKKQETDVAVIEPVKECPVIQLSPSEILMAAQVGLMRQVQNLKRDVKEKYGAQPNTDWQLNIEGALGEYALSKYLNLHWGGCGDYQSPDVGIVDCRTSGRDNARLCLHPKDKDDRIYFLLTGMNGLYTVRGWLFARDGKKKEFWADPTGKNRPAYFIPQDRLRQGIPVGIR